MLIPAPEYPKTENLLLRDEETHRLILGEYRHPAFEQIAEYHVSEKIDGTNIRLIYRRDVGTFEVRGRSDEATLPKLFQEEAIPAINVTRMVEAFAAIDPTGVCSGMVVFGEGYGPGIQKVGGAYATKKSLRIYDVVTLKDDARMLWRPWSDVAQVGDALGLNTAPVVSAAMTLKDVLLYVESEAPSIVAGIENPDGPDVPMEGVVARTDPYLFDSYGSRVRFKLKGRDLP